MLKYSRPTVVAVVDGDDDNNDVLLFLESVLAFLILYRSKMFPCIASQ